MIVASAMAALTSEKFPRDNDYTVPTNAHTSMIQQTLLLLGAAPKNNTCDTNSDSEAPEILKMTSLRVFT